MLMCTLFEWAESEKVYALCTHLNVDIYGRPLSKVYVQGCHIICSLLASYRIVVPHPLYTVIATKMDKPHRKLLNYP